MSTRLDMAMRRLEVAVEALEKKPPISKQAGIPQVDAGTDMRDGEIDAIRQLVDQALEILAEEEGQSTGTGGGA